VSSQVEGKCRGREAQRSCRATCLVLELFLAFPVDHGYERERGRMTGARPADGIPRRRQCEQGQCQILARRHDDGHCGHHMYRVAVNPVFLGTRWTP
jgi:hypothetical protein